MIDVSELITDPDFACTYTVYRRTGQWIKGRFVVSEPQILIYYGAVQPATVREIQQLGIGDHDGGVMKFFTRNPNELYITNANLSALDFSESQEIQISDEIDFRGSLYKILQIMPWQHGGWLRAFASLKV